MPKRFRHFEMTSTEADNIIFMDHVQQQVLVAAMVMSDLLMRQAGMDPHRDRAMRVAVFEKILFVHDDNRAHQ